MSLIATSTTPTVIAILSATFIAILIRSRLAMARKNRRDRERGWRVRRLGRDELVYEELAPEIPDADLSNADLPNADDSGGWRCLDLSGELLGTRRPGFVIRFESEKSWRRFPAWAHGRRDEIIARIQKACPAPLFEHDFSD